MPYKLIACDLDGTLMSTDLSLSEQNRNAIRALREKDVIFAPCTGRTLSEMRDTVENPDIRYYIYSNGAVILDKMTNKKINACLSKETSKAVFDILLSYDSAIIIHHDGKSYADTRTAKRGRAEYNVSYNVESLVRDFAIVVEDMPSLAYSLEDIECVCVFFRTDGDMEKCRAELEKNEQLLIVNGWDSNLEIFSRSASKGKALTAFADSLGIPLSEVIAIGDSDNDISMLKAAGLGLAASNATESLKKVADEVICSNDEGVAEQVWLRFVKGES